jgi:hypothetical protein
LNSSWRHIKVNCLNIQRCNQCTHGLDPPGWRVQQLPSLLQQQNQVSANGLFYWRWKPRWPRRNNTRI